MSNYKTFTINNFRKIPQIERLSEQEKQAIEVVGNVLPFKTNNYVVDELIEWEYYQDDPLFQLTFPQKGMLSPEHFNEISGLLQSQADRAQIRQATNSIRMQLNPHPNVK